MYLYIYIYILQFHLISAMEEEAIALFQRSDPEEFSFEMHAMHNKFSKLFENLIERFLIKEDITIDEFYRTVHRTVETEIPIPPSASGSGSGSGCNGFSGSDCDSNIDDIDNGMSEQRAYEHAKEIVDVVYYYTDFHHWAEMIREQIKYRAHFQTFYQKIEQVVHQSRQDT